MERQFPDEFPFAARGSQDAAQTPAAPAQAVAAVGPAPDVIEVTGAAQPAAAPEAMEIFTVADPMSVPEAEEVFDADAQAVETLSEADVVAEPAEAPLASPGLSAAARRLVTPLLAPLGAAAAVPVIVQPGEAKSAATTTKDSAGATRTGAERRRSPRQAIRARASFRSEADVTAVRTVQIVNLSLMGVRLRSNQPMTVGDRGNVRMEVGPVKWGSRVRVIQCEQAADGYEIGCEFVTNELSARPANIVNPLVWAPVKDKEREATKAA
jgi:hypothetical protein